MARTLALIASGWPILHQVSCSSEIVPNAHKQKETHQDMSLWSNGVDRERSLQKITPVWSVLLSILCGSETVPNAPKQKEMHEKKSLGSNCADREHSFREILTRLHGTNFYINYTMWLHRVSCSSETVPNAPKRKERHQNMSLGYNVVDLKHSLWKIMTRLRRTNFYIEQYRNGHKCTQTERNALKHEFRFQWCGSGALVAKHCNKTSWCELMHQLHLFGAFCTKFNAAVKRSQMHPNGKKRTKTWV